MSYLASPYVRAALAFAAFFSAVFLSPWLTLLFMVALALLYRAWEVLLIGISMDFLWLAPRIGDGYMDFFFSLPLFTLAALLLVWGLEPLRREFLIVR